MRPGPGSGFAAPVQENRAQAERRCGSFISFSFHGARKRPAPKKPQRGKPSECSQCSHWPWGAFPGTDRDAKFQHLRHMRDGVPAKFLRVKQRFKEPAKRDRNPESEASLTERFLHWKRWAGGPLSIHIADVQMLTNSREEIHMRAQESGIEERRRSAHRVDRSHSSNRTDRDK